MLYNTAAGTTVTQDALDAVSTKKICWFYFAKATYGITLGVTIKTLIYQLDMEPQNKVYNGKRQRFAGENMRTH
jgi:hypothetical protein